MRVRFHKAALNDLDTIQRWIAREDKRAAERVILRIDQSISLLEKFPRIRRIGAVEDTREISIPNTPYVVVYSEPDVDDIWIIRVIHERRQYPSEGD